MVPVLMIRSLLCRAILDSNHHTPDTMTSGCVKKLRQHLATDPEVLTALNSRADPHSAIFFSTNSSTPHDRKKPPTLNRLGKHERSTTSTIIACTNPANSYSIKEYYRFQSHCTFLHNFRQLKQFTHH